MANKQSECIKSCAQIPQTPRIFICSSVRVHWYKLDFSKIWKCFVLNLNTLWSLIVIACAINLMFESVIDLKEDKKSKIIRPFAINWHWIYIIYTLIWKKSSARERERGIQRKRKCIQCEWNNLKVHSPRRPNLQTHIHMIVITYQENVHFHCTTHNHIRIDILKWSNPNKRHVEWQKKLLQTSQAKNKGGKKIS